MNSDIISSILEIESSAKEKIERAEMLKKDIISSAEKEVRQIGDEMLRDAKAEFERLTAEERRANDEKIEEIKRRGEAEKAELDDLFRQKQKEWEDKIFSGIINI